MHIFDGYDLIIFDCDGVILDANAMKVDAMKTTLLHSARFSEAQVDTCISQFKQNFGKSRYYHVERFIEMLNLNSSEDICGLKNFLLKDFAEQLDSLYLQVPFAKGVLELLIKLSDMKLFVASGSEEIQLRNIFRKRELDKYFIDILGSPTTKAENISKILAKNIHQNALMVGDAIADYEAAESNGIDFIFYSPLSNVKTEMYDLANKKGFSVLSSFN